MFFIFYKIFDLQHIFNENVLRPNNCTTDYAHLIFAEPICIIRHV